MLKRKRKGVSPQDRQVLGVDSAHHRSVHPEGPRPGPDVTTWATPGTCRQHRGAGERVGTAGCFLQLPVPGGSLGTTLGASARAGARGPASSLAREGRLQPQRYRLSLTHVWAVSSLEGSATWCPTEAAGARPSWLEQVAGHRGGGGDGPAGGPCCPAPHCPGGSFPVAEAGEPELQAGPLGWSDTEFRPIFSVKVVVGQKRQGPCGGRAGWGPDEASSAGRGSWADGLQTRLFSFEFAF